MGIHRLDPFDMPWGDYGHMLAHGMGGNRMNPDMPFELERTGPFVPPITFPGPGGVVVTDDFRRKLEASGLSGLAFQPVIKKRIVRLNWEQWDRAAEDPVKYPAGGEPENYILGRKHSAAIADEIGQLWHLVVGDHIVEERVGDPRYNTVVYAVVDTWDGTDVFKGPARWRVLISDRAREWFEKEAGEWVQFGLVPSK